MPERRLRRVWQPDPNLKAVEQRRQMALAYQAEARVQQERARLLQEALSAVDLRALHRTDPDLAKKVEVLLRDSDVDRVAQLDEQFHEWGVDWHLVQPLPIDFDDQDWVPTRDIAAMLRVETNTVSRQRVLGRIYGHFLGNEAGYVFRVGEIRNLQMPGKGGRLRERTGKFIAKPKPAEAAEKPAAKTPRKGRGKA